MLRRLLPIVSCSIVISPSFSNTFSSNLSIVSLNVSFSEPNSMFFSQHCLNSLHIWSLSSETFGNTVFKLVMSFAASWRFNSSRFMFSSFFNIWCQKKRSKVKLNTQLYTTRSHKKTRIGWLMLFTWSLRSFTS